MAIFLIPNSVWCYHVRTTQLPSHLPYLDLSLTCLSHIRHVLQARSPALPDESGRGHAAVAAILQEVEAGLELLFIERARHSDDPWSGHIAFPGGKVEAADTGPRDAAERETREELGLTLSPNRYLGQLDDVTGHTLPVCVSGFVYVVETPGPMVLNDEVEEAFWVPLDHLTDPARREIREYRYRGVAQDHPTIDLLGRPPYLWGITYRFVRQFLRLLNCDSGLS
ncbi:MAG: CoA pyrophosphatase [Gemmatimonadales bacterium]|jgi:8-oxo-dGTP pyrophosphatase MutT (NUDIX family)|nr:CoA pyrophosphatase [Gemmatimonadales bacterium]